MDNVKNDEYYIARIERDVDFIIQKTKDLSIDDFNGNEMLQDSMMFRLIQISESAGHITQNYKFNHPEIPWKDIYGLRNRIVHDYGNISLALVFSTLKKDIPALKKAFGIPEKKFL